MKHFQLIGQFDPMPLLHQVHLHPELWGANPLRTTHTGTMHTDVDDIWLRFNDVTGDLSHILNDHEAYWYPAIDTLPLARALVMGQMARVLGTRLGRVLMTRLRPGGRIAPHADGGTYPAYYERYHHVLQGLPGNMFRCGEEQVEMRSGQIWWFQNLVEHEVINRSADDRIHLIVDVHL